MLPILTDALCGGIAGLIGYLVAYKGLPGSLSARTRQLVMIVVVVLGVQVGRLAVSPRVDEWQKGRELDEAIAKEPVFSILLADKPELRAPLRAAMLKAYLSGNRVQAVSAGSDLLARHFSGYLSRGSDESVVRFIERIVFTLRSLEASNSDNCYYYLRPDAQHPVVLGKEQGKEEMFAAMREVVVSTKKGTPVEDAARVDESLKGVIAHLREGFGDDLQVLQEMRNPEVDRAKFCRISIAMYEQILKLPQQEAGPLLRSLLGQ
ncbi:MAG: hypothetical protein J0L64_28025 [Acidobacteria bacterium]|nr:hypothetical protein [Acidobacteriota bacterium]